MNICLLTKTTLAHGLGGVEVHVETLSRIIPAMGHKLTVIATRHPDGIDLEERPGCVIHYLDGTRPARYNAAFFRESRRKFLELHRQNPFDAVWAEDFAAYGCLTELPRDGFPPLISIMQGSGLRGLIRSEWNRVTSPSESFPFFLKFFPEAILFYSFWYGRILRKSAGIVAVSHETAADYRLDHSVQHNNIRVIFNSVDVDCFSPNRDLRKDLRSKNRMNDADLIVLMAAVVHKQKGMHVGMEAYGAIAQQFPTARLWIAGGGPHLAELQSQAAALRISDRVNFFGPVKNDDMPAYYNAADVYLNPTLRFEGLAITTVEAMACGKPVIISRIGGTPSSVKEGISGFFVQPGHVEEIQERLARLLADSDLRLRMSDAARKRAVEYFNREKMARDLLAFSENLIQRNKHV